MGQWLPGKRRVPSLQPWRRETFKFSTDLRRFIDGWNDRCHPFIWTKAPDGVLSHARPRQRTSDAEH